MPTKGELERAWSCRCLDCDGCAVIHASDVEHQEDPIAQVEAYQFVARKEIEERATYPAFFP